MTHSTGGATLETLDLAVVRRHLQRSGQLVAHTIYECPSCGERFVGERRCPDCQLFCRAMGLGGNCPDCDQPILIADLLDTEVMPNQ
jgi:ribosomal protein L32